MEEDIKMIEDVLKDKDTKFWIGTQGIQAIEKLIERYKELEKKYTVVKTLNETQEYKLELYYIPKSKVQEKIEEYKRKMEKDVNYLSKDYFNYRHKIYALQELLED